MKKISICGLDCTNCPCFRAFRNNDDLLRKRTAREWTERYKKDGRNRPPVKPEDINCTGCLSTGPIYLYCKQCKIRKCGLKKGIKNCQGCQDYRCEQLMELQKHFF